MSSADAASFSESIRNLGDSIVKLTVLEAKALGDYLETVHGIKAAAAAVAVAAAPAGGGDAPAAAAAQTEFEVVLESFGDKKLDVIKVIRTITGLGLKEAKELVDGAPKPIMEKVSKDDANKAKAKLEEVGATVELA